MLCSVRLASLRFPLAFMSICSIPVLIAGCPSEKAQTREPAATCVKAGESCTVSPGKLGVCTEPGDGRRSLVCQSLH
jgi:hypothetical protein